MAWITGILFKLKSYLSTLGRMPFMQATPNRHFSRQACLPEHPRSPFPSACKQKRMMHRMRA